MATEKLPTIYERLGPAKIGQVIQEFYDRAFVDPIIGHFFHNSDKAKIARLQTSFASAMLGGPDGYRGLSLHEAHLPFQIRNVHFNRRQILMGEVLGDVLEMDSYADCVAQWLKLEEKLRSRITNAPGGCQN